MSKYKAVTGNTLQSSSEGNTGEPERPSLPLANSDNTLAYTQTTSKQSPSMLSGVTTGEKTRQHALIAKTALQQLQKAGLIKRYRVLSIDRTTVKRVRIEFDMDVWTESLDLKVLSE